MRRGRGEGEAVRARTICGDGGGEGGTRAGRVPMAAADDATVVSAAGLNVEVALAREGRAGRRARNRGRGGRRRERRGRRRRRRGRGAFGKVLDPCSRAGRLGAVCDRGQLT